MDDVKLLGFQRAEFQRAETFDSISNLLQLIIVLIAVASVVIQHGPTVYTLSVLSLLFAIFWFYTSEQSKFSHGTAERARRAIVIKNGLGIQLGAKSYSDLLMSFKVDADKAKRWEDPDYFKSNSNYGNQKLAEILEESAFWSKCLLQKYALRTWLVFSSVLILSIVSLLLIVFLEFTQIAKAMGQVTCLVLMWLITGNLFSSAINLTSSSKYVDSIEERLSNIVKSGGAGDDILVHMTDYNSVMEGVPVIPSKIYLRNKCRLNELWEERL